MTDNKGHT